MKKTLLTALAIAAFAVTTGAQAQSPLSYTAGNIFLGFRASGGTGAANSYLFNLGNFSSLNIVAPGAPAEQVVDLGSELTTVFGADWKTRGQVTWGIFGMTASARVPVYSSTSDDRRAPPVTKTAVQLSTPNSSYSGMGANYNTAIGNGASTGSSTGVLGDGVVTGTGSGTWAFHIAKAADFDVYNTTLEAGVATDLDFYSTSATEATKLTQYTISTSGVVSVLGDRGGGDGDGAYTGPWNWTGATGDWSATNNWLSNQVASNGFAVGITGASGGTITNNAISSLSSLTFSNGAGSFTLTGTNADQTLTISGGITNNSATNQTISLGLGFTNNATVNAASNSMTYSGIQLSNDSTLTVGGAFNSTISGAVTGLGSLTKSGAGTATLSVSNSFSGSVTVTDGRLGLASNNAVSSANAVSVFGGELSVDTNNTAASLTITSGLLSGSGTLTAATYALNGGTVSGNLGVGSLTVGGSSTLSGTAASTDVSVNSGSLTLVGNDRLANTASVSISNGGMLDLGTGGSDTIGTLHLNGGTLTNGTLNAASYNLNGGLVFSSLGNGTITVGSGSTTLSGIAGASTVNIGSGTLALGAGDVLTNAASVSIGNADGVLNLQGFSDTVGSFTNNGGTLSGSGTLTAATYALNGGTVSGNLGAGSLSVGGSSTLSGTAASTDVSVNSGSLTLVGNDRLANTASVSISNGGMLDLGTGGSDTIGTLHLNGGTLTNGTLTAASYNLNGGLVFSSLGNGTITVGSGSTTLSGIAGAATVNIGSGTLALGAGDVLTNTASVSIGNAAGVLNLQGFSNTVGGFTNSGGTLSGSGTLTAATYALNGGTVSGNLGVGSLTVGGSSTLSGTAASTNISINGGSLTLVGNDRLATNASVTISNAATLNIGSGSQTLVALSGNGAVSNNGSLTLNASTNSSFGGSFAGTGTLTKSGVGTVTLSGDSSAYSGSTLLTNGAIAMSGKLGGTLTVTNSGSLSGSGTLSSVSVAGGGSINPGNSPGTLSVANTLTFNTGGILNWEIDNWTGGAGLASGWDLINIGSLQLVNSNSPDQFTINISGLGSVTNFSNVSTSFVFLNATNALPEFNVGYFAVNSSGFTNAGATGSWSVVSSNNSLLLSYTVPLPQNNFAWATNSGSWSEASNWTNNAVPSNNVTFTFAGSGGSSTNDLSGITATGITFATNAGSYTLSGSNLVLSGTILNNSANSQTINNNMALGSASSLNAASNNLAIGGNIDLSNNSLTITGASNTAIGGALSGSGSLNKTGAGTATLSVSNSYVGGTTVSAGTLVASNSALGNSTNRLTVNGGTLDLGGTTNTQGTVTVAGTITNGGLTATNYQVQSGSISANLGGTASLTKSGTGTATLSGSNSFSGSVTVTDGKLGLASGNAVSSANAVGVSGGELSVDVNNSAASLTITSGLLSGSGTLTAATYALNGGTVSGNLGAGSLSVGGSSTLSGTAASTNVSINSGSLTLAGNNRLATNASVAISNAATLNLGSNSQTLAALSGNGGVSNNGSLAIDGAASSSFAGSISGNGSLTKSGAGTLTLAGSNSSTGGTLVNAGELALASTNALGALAQVSINSGTLSVQTNNSISLVTMTGGLLSGNGTLTAATYALNGGTVSGNLGAGSLSVAGSSTLSGTSASTDVSVNSGSLILAGNNRLATNASVAISNAATLNLGSNSQTLAALSGNGGVSNNGSLGIDGGTSSSFAGSIAGNGSLTKSGSGTLTLAGSNSFTGGTLVNAGELALASTNALGAVAQVSINSGTLSVQTNNSISLVTMTGGLLSGNGTLTAATYALNGGTVSGNLGAGSLSVAGSSTLSGTAASTNVTIGSGSLTLAGNNRLATNASVAISNAATLNLGSNSQTFAALSGNGGVSNNGSLGIDGAASSSFAGSISGSGSLTKSGAGTLTLAGSNSFTGGTLVNAGELALASTNALGAATAVTVNSGTLTVQSNNSVALVTMAGGTLSGNGTLTAAAYALNGGTVLGNLGAGSLTVAGSSILSGTAASTNVSINSGSLTLAGNNRLASNASVAIYNAATLNLGSNSQTLAALTGSGALSNNGSLAIDGGTSSSFAGSIAGSGSLTKSGSGTLTLSGSNSYTGGTFVNAGELALNSTNALGAVAQVSINSGTLSVQTNNSISLVTMTGGLLSGNGTLTAATYALNGGTVSGNLGAGSLSVGGSSTLSGTAAAANVSVNTGSLTLAGNNRLATNASVAISNAATLNLGSNSQTLAALSGNGGVSNNGSLAIDGAASSSFAGSIAGSGSLTKSGSGTLTLAGSNSHTGGTFVNAGELAVNSTNALRSSTISVAAGGTLNTLTNFQTTGVVSLNGGTITGPGSLSASGFALTSGMASAVLAGNASLTKSGAGTATLSVSNSYTGGTTVNDGTLILSGASATLGASNNSLTVTNSGTLDLGATNRTVGAFTLAGGSVANGTLTASSYALQSGILRASLAGNGNLTKSGTETVSLHGNSSGYSGSVSITQGRLEAFATNALGSGTVSLSGSSSSAQGVLALQTNLTIGALNWGTNGVIALTPGAMTLNIIGLFENAGGGGVFDFGSFAATETNTIVSFGTNSGFTTNSFSVIGSSQWGFGLSSNSLSVFYKSGGGGSVTNNSNAAITKSSTNSTLTVTGGTTVIAAGVTSTSTNSVNVAGGNVMTFGNIVTPAVNVTSGGLGVAQGASVTASNSVTVSGDNSVIVNNGEITTPVFSLNDGGMLMGSGRIIGDVGVQGGTVSPGNSPGTLTVTGNYSVSSGALNIEVASPSNYDKVVVSGAATLGGALNLIPYDGYVMQFGDNYTFLTAAGGISGSYSTTNTPAGIRARLLQTQTTLSALIAPTSYTQVAVTQNQINVARALDSFIPATSGDKVTVSTALDSLTASQYSAAFEAIQPTIYQSLSTIVFNNANAQNMQLVQRLWNQRIAGSGFSMSGFADNTPFLEGQGDGKSVMDPNKDILRAGPDNKWGLFVDGNGIFAQANSGNMLPNYNAQGGGVTTGVTYRVNPVISLGSYVGYQGTYSKYNGGSSMTDNSVRFGGFATYGKEDGKGLYVDALVGGGYNNYQVTRNIQFGSINRTANSAPTAGELDSMLATGYDFKRGKWTFGPTASLQYTYFGANSFSENGAQSLNLSNSGWNTSSMLSSLGAHAAYNWQAGKNIVVVPQINLSWQHEFMQNSYSIDSSLGGSTFANTSSTPIRDFLYTGIGFSVELLNKWTTSFFYNAAAGNSDLQSQNIFLSFGAKF